MSYNGSFNSSVNSNQNKDNVLNTKFSVNSNFLNKLKLKNLTSLAQRTPNPQTAVKRVLGYQPKTITN